MRTTRSRPRPGSQAMRSRTTPPSRTIGNSRASGTSDRERDGAGPERLHVARIGRQERGDGAADEGQQEEHEQRHVGPILGRGACGQLAWLMRSVDRRAAVLVRALARGVVHPPFGGVVMGPVDPN